MDVETLRPIRYNDETIAAPGMDYKKNSAECFTSMTNRKVDRMAKTTGLPTATSRVPETLAKMGGIVSNSGLL